MKLLNLLLLLFVLIINQTLFSQEQRILLDEIYSDWDNIPGVLDSNDATTGIDFYSLKTTNYNNFLFLLLEMNTEINLQDPNSLTLYIDSDNNSSTGYSVNGIGAELEYRFGEKTGKFYYDNTSTYISHEHIGLVTLPTVTSNIFEININLNSIISGRTLFPDSTMKIIVKNNIVSGDIIPNVPGGYQYTIYNSDPQHDISYSIKKLNESNLRIVSYNVERDQFFDSDKKEAHRRIFQALNPDIIGFQEIYDHTAQQTADLIEEFLPSAEGEVWYSSKLVPDIIVVSRFPITQSFQMDGNGAFLLDLINKYEKELLFINAHTPCCGSNNDSRQKEIDNFMAFIRDAKEDGGVLTLTENSPIVIVGDMNLVGYKQQQTTLITGDIINTNIYGNAFMPDWDDTYFADLKPITSNMPSTFTWYDEGSSYSPGRLDYIVYSNSVMSAVNSYVLFTNALPEDSLSLYNLQSYDVTSVADHLPVIVDFELSPEVSVENNLTLNYKFSLLQNYPNPFNPTTVIKYDLGMSEFVTLKIYNSLGQEVRTLVRREQNAGSYDVKLDASDLTSGIYFYKLTAGEFVQSKKMILLK